jgi:oxidase EvaA
MTFEDAVDAYRTALATAGLGDVDLLRAEATVESQRDWSKVMDLDAVRTWFLGERTANQMRVRKIPVGECRGWYVEDTTGWIRHESGAFFVVDAIEVTLSASREVGAAGWCQPMVSQVGDDGGVLGLVRRKVEGVPHYLVQAKAEPGNYGLVSLSPSVQATFSNLERAHGGRAPTFAEYFYPEVPDRCRVLARAWLAEDGGRLFNKRNLGVVVEVPDGEALDATADFQWLSMWQIRHLFFEDAWVNPHLFRLISMIGA